MSRLILRNAAPTFETLETRQLLSAGQLDPTFGSGGKVLTDLGLDGGSAVAVRADGKILVAAQDHDHSRANLVRYNADGSLDTTFGGGDGVVSSDLGQTTVDPYEMELLPDGKIVVAGRAYDGTQGGYAVARFNADGTLDAGFGDGGVVFIAAPSISAPNDGNAYVIIGGRVQMGVQADGKLVLAMGLPTAHDDGDVKVVRLETDGDLDPTFGTGGAVTRDLGSVEDVMDLAIDGQGRIVVMTDGYQFVPVAGGGISMRSPEVYVLRMNSDGSADASFGTGGVVTEHAGPSQVRTQQLAIDAEDRVVVLGEVCSPELVSTGVVIRYEADGDRDATFGTGGRQVLTDGNDSFVDIAVQADGKLLVSGESVLNAGSGSCGLSVRRLNADGSIDTSFAGDGTARVALATGRMGFGRAMTVTADGGVLVTGFALTGSDSDLALVRLQGDGGPAGGVQRSTKLTAKQKARRAARLEAQQEAEAAARRKARRAARRAAELAAKQAKRARKARRAARLAAAEKDAAAPKQAVAQFSTVLIG